ncbi:1-deoxy-D-xylulose-5-phosphate reductoisomerase [Patescibacteria group bacterium]|nr:1-deoxy-D-xylulose-5-phosphate reductoisomerase [Patescibacteria group bacterium]
MKKISILGSTGSIGTQTLDIVRQHPDQYQVIGLSANSNIQALTQQIKEFQPQLVSIGTKELADQLSQEIDIPVHYGMDGLIKIATAPQADTIVTAVVGSVGLLPTSAAIKAGKKIALANKETLVTAGEIIMREVEKNNISLMPVDSEHNAIFQALNGENKQEIKKIIITCSGGSFRGKTLTDLQNVTVDQALNHPTWNMGGKITIDSATLMNKGFEIIEAHHLFQIPYEKIEVVIHPQSIIHSMVEFIDGSIIAQLGPHDMRIPITYALSYPKRLNLDIPSVDFIKQKELTFDKPDTETFKCLEYAFEAGKIGGSMPCVLNATNEIAVEYFLQGKIKFLDIQNTIKKMLDNHQLVANPTIEQIIKIDQETKQATQEELSS